MRQNILLAFSFARQDLKERYIGTSLGRFWFVLSPIIMLFIYTVIFSDFMKMRLADVDNGYSYSIYLVPGILAWTSFSSMMIRLTNSAIDKAHLFKKVNVALYVFQVAIFLSEFFMFVLSMILGCIFLVVVSKTSFLGLFYLFLLMFLQGIFTFALGVIFGLLTPFFRDLKEAIPIFLQLFFWATPIIYLKSMVYDKVPFLIDFNPLYRYISLYQDIFLKDKIPSFNDIFIAFALAFCFLLVTLWLYRKLISSIKDIV